MLGLKSELIGKPYRMPDTILIYNYNFSSQWTRNAAADINDKPRYQKGHSIYKFQPVAQKKLTLYSSIGQLRVQEVSVDMKYF